MRVDVYSARDVWLGSIGEAELLAFEHSDENNGEDSVSITTLCPLKQGYRLVWLDSSGYAHEHVCQDPQGTHEGGATVYSDTALNSICETFYDYIEDKRPKSYSFARALGVALEPTRWEVGTVDMPGTVSSGLTFYHTSAREAIQSILECGGELETSITVGKGGVTKRAVGIRRHRGESSTHKRFAYDKDITSMARTEHWGAITACYGYGKGEETENGGYGRKLTFGKINGGANYVEDPAALAKYGRPDGNGGYAHLFGTYENGDCTDASQLLAETKAYLAEHSEPGVTYEADVVDLVQFGRSWEGCGVGDDVQVVDADFEPELRLEGRVSKLVTDYVNGTRTVTLGNVTDTLASQYAKQQAELESLNRRSADWDMAAYTPGAYLQQIIDGLNKQFNEQGMSYCYTSFEMGTIWATVPLNEDGTPTITAGAKAIQICSQGFRIASGVKEGTNEWDWRTFGTGDGFTADLITAGVIQGGSNHWNLDTGDLLFTQGSIANVDSEGVQHGKGTIDINMSDGSYKLIGSNGAGIVMDADGNLEISGDAIGGGELVASTEVQYCLKYESGTQQTPWSAERPLSWGEGYELWQRTAYTYLDGSEHYSPSEQGFKFSDMQTVFNELTNNGASEGLYIKDGKLYVNASYINSGVLKVADENGTLFEANLGENAVSLGCFKVGYDEDAGYYLFGEDDGGELTFPKNITDKTGVTLDSSAIWLTNGDSGEYIRLSTQQTSVPMLFFNGNGSNVYTSLIQQRTTDYIDPDDGEQKSLRNAFDFNSTGDLEWYTGDWWVSEQAVGAGVPVLHKSVDCEDEVITAIDNAETSIENNTVTVKLTKKTRPSRWVKGVLVKMATPVQETLLSLKAKFTTTKVVSSVEDHYTSINQSFSVPARSFLTSASVGSDYSRMNLVTGSMSGSTLYLTINSNTEVVHGISTSTNSSAVSCSATGSPTSVVSRTSVGTSTVVSGVVAE